MKPIAYTVLLTGITVVGTMGCQKTSSSVPVADPSAASLSQVQPILVQSRSALIENVIDPKENPAKAWWLTLDPCYQAEISERTPKMEVNERAPKMYRTGGGATIEIESVCKVVDKKVVCWNVDGKVDKDLGKRVEPCLSLKRAALPWVIVPDGRKNRLVVFKVTQPWKRVGSEFHFLTVGDEAPGYPSKLVPIGGGSGRVGKPSTHYLARSVREDMASSEARAKFSIFDPAAQVWIDRREGASASFSGETFVMKSIPRKVAPYAWKMRIKIAGKSSLPIFADIRPLDASGKSIEFVDKEGEPVSKEWYRKAASENLQMANSKVRRATIPLQTSGGASQTVDLTVRVNPARISKFAITGTTVRIVEITDIPLDPR